MTLDTNFFERPTNISAKVICDSVSEQGIRLTTFEIEYPRFIHSEVMTHRNLSKNSSSSRAIPITKMLDQIESNMAVPIYWGKNKSGMQAVEEVSKFDEAKSILNWERSYNYVKERVEDMVAIGLHKQVPNRLTEPFQTMKVVITGTDFDNFFNLRIHPDAQPEICMLAHKMYQAMQGSTPQILYDGEYHTPYVKALRDETGSLLYFDSDMKYLTLSDAIKLSVASCASVSYRTEGMTLEKANTIFDMLIKAEVVHSSPLEHIATPIGETKIAGLTEYESLIEHLLNKEGVTHINKNFELCSGNLRGYIQYRHLLPNNTSWSFDFEKRMELFK